MMLLVPPSELDAASLSPEPTSNVPRSPYNYVESVTAQRDDSVATAFMSREFSSQLISILNDYSSTDQHNGSIDLSPYLVSGWTLYEVRIDVQNLSASTEREVVGVTPQVTENFEIYEALSDIYVDELGQEFYNNQPYDGKLNNYSIYYKTTIYDPDYYGYAFFTIRSDCETGSTNLTSLVNLTASTQYVGVTIVRDNAVLNQCTGYWALIDVAEIESTEISEEVQDGVHESEPKEEIVDTEEIVEEEVTEVEPADKFVDDIESLLSDESEKNDNE